jgi:hypothetical protein
MASARDSGGPERRPACLSPQLGAVLRPELDSLAEDIAAQIRATIPEYAGSPGKDGPPELRAAVEQSLRTFVDLVSGADGSDASRARRDELCRELGRGEAYRGRSLDALQAAYRAGVQIAWRRVAEVGRRHELSPTLMSQLAEAVFTYADELASLSVEGFEQARSHTGDPRAEARRRLLRLLLAARRPTRAVLEQAARTAGWPVPATVVPVALPPRTRVVQAALEVGVLADLDRAEPALIVPGPLDERRLARLLEALPDRHGVLGPPVPPARSADSLRWARRTLALVDAGILAGTGLARAEDHLLELWLLSDQALLAELERRVLDTQVRKGPVRRMRLTETLGAWLESEGNAVETAERLDVHPQTVRYRMKQINDLYGDQLADPDSRFSLEAVLRARHLRTRAHSNRRSEAESPPVPGR